MHHRLPYSRNSPNGVDYPTGGELIERPFLTDVELAERWRMSPKTLRNLRVQGGHVPFIRIGRLVRYPREAILQFEREGLVDTVNGS